MKAITFKTGDNSKLKTENSNLSRPDYLRNAPHKTTKSPVFSPKTKIILSCCSPPHLL